MTRHAGSPTDTARASLLVAVRVKGSWHKAVQNGGKMSATLILYINSEKMDIFTMSMY